MNILIINGPNLNLLGIRSPEHYGTQTLEELNSWLQSLVAGKPVVLKFYQSNHEGAIIDTLHGIRNWADGILINPGAFSHYSYAIRDAVEAVGIPAVEVHLSDIKVREEFRRISVIAPVCLAQYSGAGKDSYRLGLEHLLTTLT